MKQVSMGLQRGSGKWLQIRARADRAAANGAPFESARFDEHPAARGQRSKPACRRTLRHRPGWCARSRRTRSPGRRYNLRPSGNRSAEDDKSATNVDSMQQVCSSLVACVLCGLSISACSHETAKTAPCHDQDVVQATRGETAPASIFAEDYFDVELDDGHVYRLTAPSDSSGAAHLTTGDQVKLCTLSSTDGSEHYSLKVAGEYGHPVQRVK